VRWWIERWAHHLGDNVLEVGSRADVANAWWINNRDLATGHWLGIDMQHGENVDEVHDVACLPMSWEDRFTGVLCSEVMEHLVDPWMAAKEMHRVLMPGGWLIVTTLFAFPEHGYPHDYFRFTQRGLRTVLEFAGFTEIQTEYSEQAIHLVLDDHGEGAIHHRDMPMHVYAVAQKKEAP